MVPANDVYVDGSLVGQISDLVVRDRERLSQDGFVLVYVPVDKQRRLAGEVQLISRGFMQMDASQDLMDKAKKNLKQALKKNGRHHDDTIRETLQTFSTTKHSLAR